MKTLYLHIGTPKTATSSLQKFLDLNQENLLSLGFSYRLSPFTYPRIGKRRNAYFLSGPGLNEALTEEDQRQYQERLDGGLAFVKEQFAACDNVLLTDEHLWLMLNYSQWDPLQILLDHAAANNYQVKVLVYLRRQDKFELSRWNQFVKGRNLKKSLEEQIKSDLTQHPLILNYAQALDKIAERIGKGNLLVRRFEPSFWPEGSIYLDFLQALGLPEDFSWIYPDKEANLGLKNNFLALKLRINNNASLSEEQKDQLTKYIRRASDCREEHSEYGLLTAEETRQFLSLFEEENARAAREFVGDGKPLFSEAITEVEKWTSDNPYMSEDLAFFLSTVSDSLMEYDKCKAQLKATEKKLTSVRFCWKQTLVCLRKKLTH